MLQEYLGSLQYYLSQQLLTFCILPKFREQSGVHPHHQMAINFHDVGNIITYHESESSYFSGILLPNGTATSSQFSSSFLPYLMPNVPPNPPNYVPQFYLVNKPPGEGKRDTGKDFLLLFNNK